MESDYPITQMTDGSQPAIHGYFDICPESPDGALVAYTKLPDGGEEGYRVAVATRDGCEHRNVGLSTTGNFHSGARPQWLDDRTVAFAVPGSSGPGTACVDVADGQTRTVPGAIRMYSSANRLGLTSAHEARILRMETEETVSVMEVDGGTLRPVLTVEDVLAIHPLAGRIDPDCMRFKHTKWSPDGTRFLVVFNNVGSVPPDRVASVPRVKSIVLVEADGSGARYMREFGHHPAWHPSGDGFVTGERRDDVGPCLVYHPIDGGKPTVFARNTGGHSAISPDGRYVVTDRYSGVKEGHGAVDLIDVETEQCTTLAVFATLALPHDRRCHAHPAWSSDGKRVYFNSAETGIAQLYALDLA